MAHDAAPRLRALIWDVDGTLAETEDEGHRVAFNRAFEEARLPWHWDRTRYAQLLAVTGGKERLRAWWEQVDPVQAAAPSSDARIRELHASKTAHYLQRLRSGLIPLRAGVRTLLGEARSAGLVQAVATTTSPENVDGLLAAARPPIDPEVFAVVGAGDVVARKKPAPDIYQWVIHQLGIDPGACLALEDSAAGVTAARAAGIAVVAIRSRFTQDDVFDGALAVLDGYGTSENPAEGSALGGVWRGVLDVATLQRWHAAGT